MNRVGFRGKETCHALMCTWTQDRYKDLKVEYKHDEKMASNFILGLGHGDERGGLLKTSIFE